MKVLFMNNYPMDIAWKSWQDGSYPENHLWGITRLHKYGIDVEILPYEKFSFINKIGNYLRFGKYLDQQLRAILKLSNYDIIYSGCQDNTFFLCLLRYLGIFKKPIICIVHDPIDHQDKRGKIFVKGHDKLVCLSYKLMNQLREDFQLNENKLENLQWAVDWQFYDDRKQDINIRHEQSFWIAAGKTQRDYNTLAKAFSEINYPLYIYCTEKSAPTIAELTSNIKISYNHSTEVDENLSFTELVKEYEKAYAVAIPLDISREKANKFSLIGLTSLLEAMAMSKAVVMTKNNQIDIDIEKEKIGIWVEPGDTEGWKQAISYLLTHQDEAIEMGLRGYALCKSKYNVEEFSSTLAKIFHHVYSNNLN